MAALVPLPPYTLSIFGAANMLMLYLEEMQPIAYFSAEYAFDELPVFAGGLGVLATDYLLEAVQDNFPLVCVGLFYHYGFEDVNEIRERLGPDSAGWEQVLADGEVFYDRIRLDGTDVVFTAWKKSYGDNATVYLLDCDVEENPEHLRKITGRLYDKDFEIKVMQDALLGIGGVQLLEKLRISPRLYHLNEGHSALASLALLARQRTRKPHATLGELKEGVCEEIVATKHTVLSAAGLYIDHDLFLKVLGEYLQGASLPVEEVFAIAQDPLRKDEFSTTRLMLEMSRDTNAVSALHAVYEKKIHPDSPYHIASITNGVHLPRWQDEEVAAADAPEELWQAHEAARRRLVEFVNDKTGSHLEPGILTVVWARRITAYKRPLELFADITVLQHIMNKAEQPVQIVIAGKPNIEDEVGVDMARQLGEHACNSEFRGKLVYLQDYNLTIADYLVKGADVWINTPERGYEASGTSGMKAGANGVLQFSVSDGWVDELKLGTVGWKLPDVNTADAIYGYLEHEIAPLFYRRGEDGVPAAWCKRMRKTIQIIERDFSTRRMLKEYKERLYRLG